MSPRRLILAGIGLAVLTAMLGYASLPGMIGYAQDSDDETLARAVVDACASEKDRPLCYEKRIPELMDVGLSMESAYQVTRIVQQLDPDYVYCHVLAHNISAREAARDLSKWKDVIARSPSGLCGNGGLHGAFQERFRAESLPDISPERLRDEFDGVCDPRDSWEPTFLERSSCMHGIGHLTMYVTEAAVDESIAMCELLANTPEHDHRRTCLDGAFMQIFQPLEPEDIALVEGVVPTREERIDFCDDYEGIAFTSCIKESWPLLRDVFGTPAGFAEVCAPVSDDPVELEYCVSGNTHVVFGLMQFDVPRMMELCEALDEPIRTQCIARASSRFIESDWGNIPKALAACEQAPPDAKDACYEELTRFAVQGFRSGSDEARSFCSGMPPPWRERCAEGTRL